MVKENFYTGEQVNSPYISEAEAEQNASFGRNFAQTQYGLGGNAYQNGPGFSVAQQGGYYYNPYQNYMTPPQPQNQYCYNQQMYGNPAFQFLQQQQQKSQEQYYIPPINFGGGEYLPPVGIQEEISNKTKQLIDSQLEQDAKNIAERSRMQRQNNYNPFIGGYNYFGGPMYAYTQSYNPYIQEVYNWAGQVKEDARQARREFNIGLSKMVHHYLNDGVTDTQIEEMYTGKYIGSSVEEREEFNGYIQQMQFQQKMSTRLVKIDPATKWRNAIEAVQDEIRTYLPPDATIEEASVGMNKLWIKWQFEEEQKRRRSFAVEYKDSGANNSYKYLIRRKKAERIAQEQGFSLDPNTPMQIVNQIVNNNEAKRSMEVDQLKMDFRKRLAEAALKEFPGSKLDEDGNVVLTPNLPTEENMLESQYNSLKDGFNKFAYSIPKIDQKPKELIDETINNYESSYLANTVMGMVKDAIDTLDRAEAEREEESRRQKGG